MQAPLMDRSTCDHFLRENIEAIYSNLTNGFRSFVRVEDCSSCR